MEAVNKTKLTEGGLPNLDELSYLRRLINDPFRAAWIVLEAKAPEDDPVREDVSQAEIRGENGPERALEESGDHTLLHEYANYIADVKDRIRRHKVFMN